MVWDGIASLVPLIASRAHKRDNEKSRGEKGREIETATGWEKCRIKEVEKMEDNERYRAPFIFVLDGEGDGRARKRKARALSCRFPRMPKGIASNCVNWCN